MEDNVHRFIICTMLYGMVISWVYVMSVARFLALSVPAS